MLLRQLGFIAAGESLPFFTDPTWARVTVILINIWVGVPYTLLQLTGVLQNIPADLYEAATVDGANAVQTFFRITLPYMFYVTTPYLISTFTGNVNNFNVIYLLSGGDPVHRPGLHRRQHRPAGHLAVQADHRPPVLQCGRRRRHPDIHHPGRWLAADLPPQQVLP